MDTVFNIVIGLMFAAVVIGCSFRAAKRVDPERDEWDRMV